MDAKPNRILRIERTILHEFPQGLAHRGSADAQPNRPVAILQAGARGEIADDQGSPKMLINLGVQWRALADGRCGGGDR
jgi:hypothetical protein